MGDLKENACNMTILRSWREQKIMLKRRYPFLNDEDFLFEEGNKETMLKRLQAKLNKTASELESLFGSPIEHLRLSRQVL